MNRKVKRQHKGKARRKRPSFDFSSLFHRARSYLPDLSLTRSNSKSLTTSLPSLSIKIVSSEQSSSSGLDLVSYLYQQPQQQQQPSSLPAFYSSPREEREEFPPEKIDEADEYDEEAAVIHKSMDDDDDRIPNPGKSDLKNIERSRTMDEEVHEFPQSQKDQPRNRSFLLSFGFGLGMSSRKLTTENSLWSGSARGKPPPRILRDSYVANMTKSIKDAFTEMKIVPFMEEGSRKEYEVMLLAEACGKINQPISPADSTENRRRAIVYPETLVP